MDICKWLDEVVLPQQPQSPHSQLVHCHAPRLERTGRVTSGKHKSKSTSSDSSLLQGPMRPSENIVLPERGEVKENTDRGAHTDGIHKVHTGGDASSEPYKRKPRRKTRPERYEPVAHDAEEWGTHTRKHQRSEPRRARRVSRRSKADKSGSGVVQNFQAKNVPRDRLTVAGSPVTWPYWWRANNWSS